MQADALISPSCGRKSPADAAFCAGATAVVRRAEALLAASA